jgi:3-deoxy-D-manno-octulosonic-acid transferase
VRGREEEEEEEEEKKEEQRNTAASVNAAKVLFEHLLPTTSSRCDDKEDNRALNVVVTSTHDNEELIVARAFLKMSARHRVVYVPRHPDRCSSVVLELERSQGIDFVDVASVCSNSEHPSSPVVPATLRMMESTRKKEEDKERATAASGVVVVSAMGVLSSLYSAADVAIVGGSLIPTDGQVGQHNILEPLNAGCVALYGHHCGAFFFSFQLSSTLYQLIARVTSFL